MHRGIKGLRILGLGILREKSVTELAPGNYRDGADEG